MAEILADLQSSGNTLCLYEQSKISFAVVDTVAKRNVWTWIAGKRYNPQQKSPRKDKSVHDVCDVH